MRSGAAEGTVVAVEVVVVVMVIVVSVEVEVRVPGDFPMGFLGLSYGFPMAFLWVSYGFPMGFLKHGKSSIDIYGFSTIQR